MKCSDTLLKIIKEVEKETNIGFYMYRCNTLARRLRHRYIRLQMKDEREYLNYFKRNTNNETRILKNLFLINTTQFFRVPLHFAYLFTVLNREIKLGKDYIKVLDIGCSSGEETYSIAMILNELKTKNRNFEYHIDAIDIDKESIEMAKKAVYTKESLNNVPLWLYEKYFKKTDNDNMFELRKALFLDNINFINADILTYNSTHDIHGIFKYDVIFCENLLIYLKEYARKIIFKTIVRLMKNGGLLFLSESEDIDEEFRSCFHKTTTHSKIFKLRKGACHEKV